MIKKIFALFLIYNFISCNKPDNYDSFFLTKRYNYKNLKKIDLKFTALYLENINSSYTGEIDYSKDYISFIDYRFCYIFDFYYSGKLARTKLGQGKLDSEVNIGRITRFAKLSNGNRILFGHSNDIHIFDENWKKIFVGKINWNGSVDYGQARNISHPKPTEKTIYSFSFDNTLAISNNNNSIFIPIYSEHRDFNGFIGYEYYREGRILAELDFSKLSDVNVSNIFGRRTPELLKYKYLPHHSGFSFDIDKNNNDFYVANEIDSTIYVYDKNFKVKYAFGFSGSNMDTKYNELKNFDVGKYRELFFQDRPKKGYYYDIKVFDKGKIVFRSYKKSFLSKFDGLQVYKNKALIYDIDVPKNFAVKYTKDGYYFSNVFIDEENEKLKILKFKL